MIPELFNYKTSFLNPALKILVTLIFLSGSFYFYRIRNQYQGEIGKVVSRLAIVGFIGFLASFFRYGADIWFVDLKWGESIGYLCFALANVYAVWPLVTYIREVKSGQPAVKK
jgi:hypothetical protein